VAGRPTRDMTGAGTENHDPMPRFARCPPRCAARIEAMTPGSLGRMILVAAAILALVGVALVVAERFPGLRIGRLPGDIKVQRGNFTFYFPLATSILVSILLTLAFWLARRR